MPADRPPILLILLLALTAIGVALYCMAAPQVCADGVCWTLTPP